MPMGNSIDQSRIFPQKLFVSILCAEAPDGVFGFPVIVSCTLKQRIINGQKLRGTFCCSVEIRNLSLMRLQSVKASKHSGESVVASALVITGVPGTKTRRSVTSSPSAERPCAPAMPLSNK